MGGGGEGGVQQSHPTVRTSGTLTNGRYKSRLLIVTKRTHIMGGVGCEGIYGMGKGRNLDSHTKTILETTAFAYIYIYICISFFRSTFVSQLVYCRLALSCGSCPLPRLVPSPAALALSCGYCPWLQRLSPIPHPSNGSMLLVHRESCCDCGALLALQRPVCPYSNIVQSPGYMG